MKYGIFIGRFQPFHIGHEAAIHEIIADGLKPVICIGSTNKQDSRNPFTYSQRRDMIRRVFDLKTIGVPDDVHDDRWFKIITSKFLVLDKAEIVWYYNIKDCDKQDFVFKGKEYCNEHYIKMFQDSGYETKAIQNKLGLKVCATDIRKDLESNRHYLDARVYQYIKELSSGKEEVFSSK